VPIHKKLAHTIRNFRSIAYHHYGRSPWSYVRFIYYSLFRANTFLVFERDLRRELPDVELPPGIEIASPSLEDLGRLREGRDLPREFFCDQLHDARTCCVGFCDGEIAYVHWVYSKGEYSRFLNLGQDVCEINHVTTLPSFRGRRLSMTMLERASRSLQRAGYKKVVLVVHENNVAFIKNLERLGFEKTTRIRTIGPFNRKVSV